MVVAEVCFEHEVSQALPVLCQNSIHWQRYKRAVDAAWTVGPAATIEQSYPLDGSSAW